MRFIEIGNSYYNIAHIRSVRRPAKGDNDTVVEFTDGETKVISGHGYFHRRFGDLTGDSIVAAQPGFMLVRHWGEASIDRLPIIAWAVDLLGEDFATRPVTVDGIPFDNSEWAVLQPDGRVIRPGDRSWDSCEEWLADVSKKKVEVAS